MGMDNLMKKETCPAVLGIYKRLRTRPYNNHYKRIAEHMTDDALQAIGASTTGAEVLLWASHKLAMNSLYLFWERILINRKCFTDNFIAAIWLEMFTACGDLNHQHPVERDGTESDFWWQDGIENDLPDSIITSPYLLESPTVIRRYCQARKNGWETLRYTRGGRQWSTLHSWKAIRKEIEEDSVPGFEMGRTMLGSRLSFSIIAEILNSGAWKIFRYLLENDLEELEKNVPLEEIACHAVSQFPDKEAIEVLNILEEIRPGITGNFRDAFGQNLLWYGMSNPRSCWFHPNCRLTAFLLDHGCSPELPTNIGLSWRFLTDSLTDRHKDSLWRSRITVNRNLAEEQPNLWSKQ